MASPMYITYYGYNTDANIQKIFDKKKCFIEFIKYLYLKCFSWYKVIFLFLSESCIEVSVHDSFSDKVSCPCDVWSISVHILHNLIDLRFIKRDDSIIEF